MSKAIIFKDAQQDMDRVALRQILSDYFSQDELHTLCFDLGIDFESLGGESKQAKAREIVAYCERTTQTTELVTAIRRLRPKVGLPDEHNSRAAAESNENEPVTEPAVARPVNLSFEAVTLGGWPAGWFNSQGFVTGVSTTYQVQVVPREAESGKCVFIQNQRATEVEFGSLMQRCPARNLAGRAIRIEADIRTEQVEQWAGLWLRADGEVVPDLVFDNMGRRPIRGTTPWQRYALDVQLPAETAWLNYGIVLSGRGTMWADNFKVLVWASNGKWVDI